MLNGSWYTILMNFEYKDGMLNKFRDGTSFESIPQELRHFEMLIQLLVWWDKLRNAALGSKRH